MKITLIMIIILIINGNVDFVKKYYSKNYPYKSHLKRCLVHSEEQENKFDMLGDLMTDLKNELKHDFKNELFKMINEIKDEVKNDVKKINYQPQPKKIIYPF